MREAEKKRLIKLWKEARKMAKEANSDIEREMIFTEHLLENGVIVPPCKVGQTVYRIYTNSWIGEDKICEFVITERGLCYYDDKGRETSCDKFGKLVFSTKEEAEYALKNRRSVSLVDGHIEE